MEKQSNNKKTENPTSTANPDETLNLDETLDLHIPQTGQVGELAPNSFFRGGMNVTDNIGVLKDSFAVDESTFIISTVNGD